MTAVLGWEVTAPVPDVDDVIALGYTEVRFYYASSEAGSYSQGTPATLVSGTLSYSYNRTTGLLTDWWQWCYYGATPGESTRTDPQPVTVGGLTTRKAIRQAVGVALHLCDVFTLASVTDADTAVISETIDADAQAAKYARRFVRVSGGTAIGQTRRINAASNAAAGYVPASGTFNINRATSPAWVAGDEVELWVARGDADLSAMIDTAMQYARRNIWIDDEYILVTEDSQSEFPMPQGMSEDHAGAPEVCWGTYPDDPDWQQVGWHRPYTQGGQTWMTIRPAAVGINSYGADRIIRIPYSHQVDEMDSDTDTWPIDLRWAVAEVGVEFLRMLFGPGGGAEDVADIGRAYGVWKEQAATYRAMFNPAAKPVEVPIR